MNKNIRVDKLMEIVLNKFNLEVDNNYEPFYVFRNTKTDEYLAYEYIDKELERLQENEVELQI